MPNYGWKTPVSLHRNLEDVLPGTSTEIPRRRSVISNRYKLDYTVTPERESEKPVGDSFFSPAPTRKLKFVTHNIEGHDRSNNSCQTLIAKFQPDFFLRQEDWLFGF